MVFLSINLWEIRIFIFFTLLLKRKQKWISGDTYIIKEACEKRMTNVLDIPSRKYAFDSTTIPLRLATFPMVKSEGRREVTKPMSYITLKLRSRPSIL